LARAERRRRALEALELERNREAALRGQLQDMAAEVEGERVDAQALSRLSPEERETVRAAWTEAETADLDLGDGVAASWLDEEDERASPEEERQERLAEIARLQEEIAASQRRQRAFQRYLHALLEQETSLAPSEEGRPESS